MFSGTSIPAPVNPSASPDFKKIRFVTALYILLLLAIGVELYRSEESVGLPISLSLAFVPAILYGLAAFRYLPAFIGPAVIAGAAPSIRTRSWSRWVWFGTILSAFHFPITIAIALIFHLEKLSDISSEPGFFTRLLPPSVIAPLLFAWIGTRFFLSPPAATTPESSRSRVMLAASLTAGALLVFSSLLLHTDYGVEGWKILLGRSPWVTSRFIPINWMEPWSDTLLLIFYVVAILFAMASVVIAVRILAGATLAPRLRNLLLHGAVLLCWFTVTNYLGNLLYLQFAENAIFAGPSPIRFVAITVGWLTLFFLAAFFWLRFSRRSDHRSQTIVTLLVVLAVPQLLMVLSTLWIPAGFGIFGLVTFFIGVQIFAACYWKFARVPLPSAADTPALNLNTGSPADS